jgi:hypothetical protein
LQSDVSEQRKCDNQDGCGEKLIYLFKDDSHMIM